MSRPLELADAPFLGTASFLVEEFLRIKAWANEFVQQTDAFLELERAYHVPRVAEFLRSSCPPDPFEALAAAEQMLTEQKEEALDTAARVLQMSEASLPPALAWLHSRISALSASLRAQRCQRDTFVEVSRTQRKIIELPGSVFLQGRSGTGKTVCIIQRILHRRRFDPAARCLFITRSSLLCSQVVEELRKSCAVLRSFARLGPPPGSVVCMTWDELVAALLPSSKSAIQYPTFLAEYWPALRPPLDLEALLVWAEFHNKLRSFNAKPPDALRGRVSLDDYREKQTLDRAGLSLTQEQYCQQTTASMGVCLRKDQMRDIYRMFLEYLRLKLGKRRWDATDVAAEMRSTLEHALFSELYVDEAQDFSPAELTALISLCRHDVMIAGDTCQTINPGSAFGFQEIMDAFQELDPKPFPEEDQTTEERSCCQMSLGFNYRSSPQIVMLANTVSDLLIKFFPASVDAVEEDASGSLGKPSILVRTDNVLGVIMGSGSRMLRTLDSTRCVVLVRDSDARTRLRALGVKSTILTIQESKGLEYDFVILYNFFSDCPAPNPQKLWRTVDLGPELASTAATSEDLPTVTRGKRGKYDRALPNIAAAAMMIPELKHLYVGITRARFGCAFVESGQVWQELANNWSAAGLVTLIKDTKEYAATGTPDEMPKRPVAAPQSQAALPVFTSSEEELAWIWSELTLRVGPQQKQARKMLGQERMRLQAGHVFDGAFAAKLQAAHGPNLFKPPAQRERSAASEGKLPDLVPITELLQRRSDYHQAPSSLSSAGRQLQARGERLLRHALDDPEQRWPVFEEARAILTEARRCAGRLLEEQLRNRGRCSLETLPKPRPSVSEGVALECGQDAGDPKVAATVVQLTVTVRVSAVCLQDDMFHDVVRIQDTSHHEVLTVKGVLLSGRELDSVELPASVTVAELQQSFQNLMQRRCRLLVQTPDGFLDVSAMDPTLTLRSALARSMEDWWSEVGWHRAVCAVLQLQMDAIPLSRVKLPKFWEQVFVLLSPQDVSEARASFRMTAERVLEFLRADRARKSAETEATAWLLRCRGRYSTEVMKRQREAVAKMGELDKQHECACSKILAEKRLVTPALAVRAALYSAHCLELRRAALSRLTAEQRSRSTDWHKAGDHFRELGDIPNAAAEYECAAEASYKFFHRWRGIGQRLGVHLGAILSQAQLSATSAARCLVVGGRLRDAERLFLLAGKVREADALAVWSTSARDLLRRSQCRSGLVAYCAAIISQSIEW
ncbi:unnamed protein product [Effrenium voratum]|nr:unnamed protein product [Effrenium voratum]